MKIILQEFLVPAALVVQWIYDFIFGKIKILLELGKSLLEFWDTTFLPD